MTKISQESTSDSPSDADIPIYDGDCMSQADFHAAYEAMPLDYRAELIAGMVHEPSPVSWPHGESHGELISLVRTYVSQTPGTTFGNNATIILSPEDEVQPDITLRISEEYGGRSRLKQIGRKERKYVEGAPELVAEIASSSRAIDLHLKKQRYSLAGVREYIVVCLEPKRFYWFNLEDNKELFAGSGGIFRSFVFPGLWIDCDGLLQLDYARTTQALNQGLATPEHREFVAKLQRIQSCQK